jgi:hypothetical protein
MNEIEIFGTFSGLMINRNKTEQIAKQIKDNLTYSARVFENLWYPAIVHYTSLNITVWNINPNYKQRLKKVLEKIVNNDQTGYIKNRFIGFNHRQIQDIIDFAESYNVEGAIVFIDFKKAFERSFKSTFKREIGL